MVAVKGRKSSNKNPPILSHEFVIQNHADIVSCVAMVFVIGLMVQITSPWAYTFIALHHNVSVSSEAPEDPLTPPKYTTGWKDACAVFFYFLITIVMHAVIQEYVFDKISKRLHLSKVKLSKFNESSQLIVFYVLSIIWGTDIIIRENLILNGSSLWLDYPGSMSFSLKLFFIGQLAYWLHTYPELYFQRIKKEEIPPRVVYATVGLLYTFAAYFLNFQHVGVILLVLHYLGDLLLHSARLVHFINQNEKTTQVTFFIANSIYVLCRKATFGLAAVVFLHGLAQIDSNLDYNTGTFNTPLIRYSVFGAIAVFQCYLLFVFVKKQVMRGHENKVLVVSKSKSKSKLKKKDTKKTAAVSEDDDLPEVDQATKKNLRSRSSAKAK